MGQILLAYGLPKETVTNIMMLYRNMKVKVHSPDGDTIFFNIVAGVLQGDTLALYLYIICPNYIRQTLIDLIKENGFTLKKARNRQYPTENIMDADYADDSASCKNTYPNCVACSKQQETLASIWMQTKQNKVHIF